ncbi:hypothetical protein KP509_33G054600 [Ceratopteris richardii]|uniref:Uncharacterized protein n=1 Tax=Ceratopteris richardii TaxID=49495 RepID=A0A8T2QRM1_CERRI|nr:hypothetical protein KP509_33G054600 [Ceratopteris richardii]
MWDKLSGSLLQVRQFHTCSLSSGDDSFASRSSDGCLRHGKSRACVCDKSAFHALHICGHSKKLSSLNITSLHTVLTAPRGSKVSVVCMGGRDIKSCQADLDEDYGEWSRDIENEMLRLMEEFEDSLPIIRTYKNDTCSLQICGSAPRISVLTAMAADKTFTASTDLLLGRRLTIRQTVLPGASGLNSSVSTKLFAPSLQVVERAKRLSLPKGLSAGEFLPKFFEAVQMLHPSKFYVEIYDSGHPKSVSKLEEEERIDALYSFEASTISALNEVGRAISLYAVHMLKSKVSGNSPSSLMKMLPNKFEWIPSHDSPVRFRVLTTAEIKEQARLAMHAVHYVTERNDRLWWPVPVLAFETAKKSLDNAMDDWILENLPMHKMCIDPVRLDSQGAENISDPKQIKEFNLTHSQLVDLAGVFDLYYEDRFTISDKEFQSGASLDFYSTPKSKMDQFIKAMTLGTVILGTAIFAWLVAKRLRVPSQLGTSNLILNTTDVAVISKSDSPSAGKNDFNSTVNEQLPAAEIESLCMLVITNLVKSLEWDVELHSHPAKGAWTESRSGGHQSPTNTQQLSKAAEVNTECLDEEDEKRTDVANVQLENSKDANGKIDVDEQKQIPMFQLQNIGILLYMHGISYFTSALYWCWCNMLLGLLQKGSAYQ